MQVHVVSVNGTNAIASERAGKRAYLQEEGERTSLHGGSSRTRGSHGARRRLRRGAACRLVIAAGRQRKGGAGRRGVKERVTGGVG